MGYRQIKQTAIWGFVGLNLLAEMYANDVFMMDYVNVSYNISVMVFMTYLLGSLIWVFLGNHVTSFLLTKTSLRHRDVKTIFVIISYQKMSKNVTYSEFNEIVDIAYVTCLRKMVGAEEDIHDMVIACAYVIYQEHVLESQCGVLPEIRQLENQYYDFIKIAESLYNYSK